MLALLLLGLLATGFQATAQEPVSPPPFYAVEMKVMTPKGNVWSDYDVLFHEGTVQSGQRPATLSYTGDGQCPTDHPTCAWRGTLANVELAFYVEGHDEQGRPLGHFRIGVVNLPPQANAQALTREATGSITDGLAQVEMEPDGRLPGYLFEITFRPLKGNLP